MGLWFLRSDDYTMREYYAMGRNYALSELTIKQYEIFRCCYNRKMKAYNLSLKRKFKIKL